ncbi:hypothetical protein V6N13_080596 [Hibiscus sabdariffa]|uniref:Uncharacterized protein n=2 Tax=Hibiscus sabdariffa TaxID=183260 RepID=A0ABR2APP8_9ROSI
MLAISAEEQGMQLVSIVTSSRAVIGELGSKSSVLNMIPSVVQVSLNVTPELTQQFKLMMETGTLLCPQMDLKA